MELYWRDTLQPPSEADYLQMIANKTGGLFRLILRLLLCAGSKFEYDIRPLVDVVGLMFQILDDYKNLKDDRVRVQISLPSTKQKKMKHEKYNLDITS